MLNGNERLIIILGMAHSGTTILTYVLQQHPDVMCCADGQEAWIMENTWIPSEQSKPIQEQLDRTNKRILLKRPWASTHGGWLKREMPNAKFICCYRNFVDISASWSKPTSFVADSLRNGGKDYQLSFYNEYWRHAINFSNGVPFFRRHYHLDFIANPAKIMSDICSWLGLRPFIFDVSQVSATKDIKELLLRI